MLSWATVCTGSAAAVSGPSRSTSLNRRAKHWPSASSNARHHFPGPKCTEDASDLGLQARQRDRGKCKPAPCQTQMHRSV
eukprot:126268-Rhodomonas_salina.2